MTSRERAEQTIRAGWDAALSRGWAPGPPPFPDKYLKPWLAIIEAVAAALDVHAAEAMTEGSELAHAWAVEREREACARVAEAINGLDDYTGIAAAIRARSQP